MEDDQSKAEYERFQRQVVSEASRGMGEFNVLSLIKKYSGDSDTVYHYLGKMRDEGKLFGSGREGFYQVPIGLVMATQIQIRDGEGGPIKL